MKKNLILLLAFVLFGAFGQAQVVLNDTTKAYSMPLLTKTLKGDVLLSWTEKDTQGQISFCMATSKDKGKTFTDKKSIATGYGIGNSRLMRAKILSKKDGTLVAVFSNRADATPNQTGRGGPRALDIAFCTSTDQGNTWTAPKSVDTDPTKCTRGFFDAAVMANDEIVVIYLKDVANSTKHEERDLRMVVTKNGIFQPEKVIDPVVCDCCNISLLLDAKGALNVYYRDNNDDVRDIARMTSIDNAETFSKPQIVHNDGWKINGCPHNGPTSTIANGGNLIAWFSGSETDKGIRLVTQEGKKLVVLNDASAKNAFLTGNVLLWEQNTGEGNLSQIGFKKITGDKVSETVWLKDATNTTNSTGLVAGNQLLVAYEVKQANKRNSIKIGSISL